MEWSDTTLNTLKAALMALIFAAPGSALRAQESPPWNDAATQADGISAEADGDADELIRDEQGRTAYNVRIDAEAASRYMKNFIPSGKYPDYQKGEIVNLIMAIERQYQFEIYSMTSWTVAGFSAYLTDEQVAELRQDPRILEISPDRKVTLSADTTAVWQDSQLTPASPPNGLWSTRFGLTTEVQSWGKRAVNQTTATSNGTSLVYVVDIGVGVHEDLDDNVVERVNPVLPNPNTGAIQYDCGSRSVPGLKACDSTEGKPMMPYLVGCYTHATAVAGIIGAKSNGKGTVGINPGVKIVSVSFTKGINATTACSRQSGNADDQWSAVYLALDWVKADIARNPSPKLAVVNLSANVKDTSNSLRAHVYSLATPTATYRGAFVVQSAGNQFANACEYAYRPTSQTDGIMVVGAINNHGQPVVPLNGARGFWKSVYEGNDAMGHEAGSNYGSCVEAWAPGDAILTTMGPVNSQSGTAAQPYRTYAYGSGTSFAAPHVAGLASYLIETVGFNAPQDVERNIREVRFSNLGSTQPATSAFPPAAANFHNTRGAAINLPTMNPLGPGVAKNTPYAEFVAASLCFSPKFVNDSSGCRKLEYTNNLWPFMQTSSSYGIASGMAPNNGSLAGPRVTPVWFAFDSYGTGNYSCDVTVDRPSSGPSSVIRSGGQYYYVPATSYSQAGDSYPPYMHSTACPSASVTVP